MSRKVTYFFFPENKRMSPQEFYSLDNAIDYIVKKFESKGIKPIINESPYPWAKRSFWTVKDSADKNLASIIKWHHQ